MGVQWTVNYFRSKQLDADGYTLGWTVKCFGSKQLDADGCTMDCKVQLDVDGCMINWTVMLWTKAVGCRWVYDGLDCKVLWVNAIG